MNQIYFTADLHFGHANILKHSPNRPYSDTVNVAAHDKWLLDMWRSTVDKRDTIYILGDLTFLKSEEARHLLEKLPGHKFLIEGNHDGSIRAYKNYFKEVYQIKEMRFRTTVAPFLKEDFNVVMCHYPMVTWNKKPYGSIVYYDFQGWPEYKMNLREVLMALGGKVEGNTISFDLKDPLMDVYPRILVDDGMGYGVDENVIVSVDPDRQKGFINIFREKKPTDEQQAELARQADSHMSMEKLEAFHRLEALLDKKRSKGKMVVFIDELPWLEAECAGDAGDNLRPEEEHVQQPCAARGDAGRAVFIKLTLN